MRTRQNSDSSTIPKLGSGRGVPADASSIGILSDQRESKGPSRRSPHQCSKLLIANADASSIGILSDQRESKGLSYHSPLCRQRSQLLIANLELEFRLTGCKTNHMQFSNRKFSAIFPHRFPRLGRLISLAQSRLATREESLITPLPARHSADV
jgi:hypothetical protein